MNALIDTAIGHSRTVLMTLVLLLIAGVTAYISVPKESDPDINIPIVYVSMAHDGISPEDAERLLVRPMENELRSVEGIKELRSAASQGHASVTLEFEAGFDADKAMEDVREKVDLVKPDLPSETEEPEVHEVNFALFPVIAVTLAGDMPERTLVSIARKLRDDLEALPGVLEVDIAGDRDELLEVIIDPLLLETYGLNPEQIINAIAPNNQLVPAGSLDTGRGKFAIKVPGLIENADDILDIPLKVSGDAVVHVRDVTRVQRTYKDAVGFARMGGEKAIVLEVKKRIGGNVIETVDHVRKVVNESQERWPDGIEVTFTQDKSNDIRTMLGDLQNNVIAAILLVMVVVVAALGMRSAGLVGLAIPSSFLLGILVLWAVGLTVNIVVLFALILAVGMLVDGAIVVTEYADRKMAEGMHRKEAYAMAAKRMAWPITASTATTLAAFMPLLFWPGVVGEFMKYLPITLIATLAASLLMALVFVPTVGSLVGKAGAAHPDTLSALSAAETGNLDDLRGGTGLYVKVLRFAVRYPLVPLIACIVIFFGVINVYGKYGKGVEFFPEVEPEQAMVVVHARGNLSAIEQDSLVREVERIVLQVPGMDAIYTRSGDGAAVDGQDMAEDVIGVITLEFADWQDRRKASVILDDIRDRTKHISGIYVDARVPSGGPPKAKDVEIALRAIDPEVLPGAVLKIRQKLESMDSLVGVEDSLPNPGIEWHVTVDRAQAGYYGANVATVGNMVQLVTTGIKISTYRPNDSDDEVDIRVRFPLDERGISQLDTLRIPTENGSVPLSNFVHRTPEPKTGTIRRSDNKRVYKVLADVKDGLLVDDQVQEIRRWIAEEANLDPKVQITFEGDDEEQKQAEAFLSKAFVAALFIMAIILVTQFNSFYHAGLILSAVIMSTIGVFVGLLVTGTPFGIVMTGIGVISLAGIVVNNNIVLIDTYARLKKSGMPAAEAVIRTGAQRLRPVMLTTVTTVLGLLPMVFNMNINFATREVVFGAPSSQWWTGLSLAVVAGLSFATVLTLVLTPSMLALGARTSEYLAHRRSVKKEKRAAKRNFLGIQGIEQSGE